MRTLNKVSSQGKGTLNFAWVFKPIIYWIRIMMGVDLRSGFSSNHHLEGHGTCLGILSGSFACFLLIFTLSVNILSIIYTFKEQTFLFFKEKGIEMTQSNLMIIYITAANNCFENASVYLLFLMSVVFGRWKSLCHSFEQIELHFPYLSREFYGRCRKISFIGLLFVMAVI